MPVAAPAGAGQCPQAPGRDGGPSGLSSFLEFWPCCHSDGGPHSASPTPPPRSRFPLLLKIPCVQQEPTRRRTRAGPPTSSLSPTPAPSDKRVPVPRVRTSLKAVQAHRGCPKPDARLCSGGAVARSPRRPTTHRGAGKPSPRPSLMGRAEGGRARQRLPRREAQWHSEEERGRWCQTMKIASALTRVWRVRSNELRSPTGWPALQKGVTLGEAALTVKPLQSHPTVWCNFLYLKYVCS